MNHISTIVGINVPWLGGAYGHDLGKNYTYPDWPISFDECRVEKLFSTLNSFEIRHVRFWLFEDGEGIVYDNEGQAIGVDKLFLKNLSTFVMLARKFKIQVYWVLLDANSVRRRVDMVTCLILTRIECASHFFKHVIIPIIPIISEVAWAIDLCNEPEAIVKGNTGNNTGLGFEWYDLVPSFNLLADSIRSECQDIAISIGSGFQDYKNILTGFYWDFRIDAFDFHSHSHNTLIPSAESLAQDRPIVLGELGWPIPGSWEVSRECWRASQENLSSRIYDAVSQGMAAIFLWAGNYCDLKDVEFTIYDYEAGNALHTVFSLKKRGLIDVSSYPSRTLMDICKSMR